MAIQLKYIKKNDDFVNAYDNEGYDSDSKQTIELKVDDDPGISTKRELDAPSNQTITAEQQPNDNDPPVFENIDPPEGAFIDFVLKIQNAFNNFWENYGGVITTCIYIILIAGYFVYFAFALEYDFGDEPSIRLLWCTCAVIFFWIIYLIKRYLGDSIIEKCMPCTDSLEPHGTRINIVSLLVLYIFIIIWVFVDVLAVNNQPYNLVSLSGIFLYVLLFFIFSYSPAHVRWRTVGWGLGLQFLFAILILRTDWGYTAFEWLGERFTEFLDHTDAGSIFVFGEAYTMHYFAFKVMPVVVFFSSVISCFYYLGWMQVVIKKIAWVMQITMGTTAGESLNAAGNIFIGQTEAPLMIKPMLKDMTMSEIHAVMTGGFATIAGGVLAAFILMGVPANHLISASVMSAPAALAMSKLFWPETQKSVTNTDYVDTMAPSSERNVIEAASNGASAAISLVANIIANLIAFLALLEFINSTLTWFGHRVGIEQPEYEDLTLELICSYVLYPFAVVMGVEPVDCRKVAKLIGIKTIINEFVAYENLGQITTNIGWYNNHTSQNMTVDFHKQGVWLYDGAAMVNGSGIEPFPGQVRYSDDGSDVYLVDGILTERSRVIATYALCGFSNIASIGIQLGALGAMAPNRKSEMAKIVLRAMIAGNVACFMTAAISGLFFRE